MKRTRTSIIIIIVLAVVTFVLVSGLLTSAREQAPVVVAARALEAGTRLVEDDVKVVQIHAGAVLDGAFEETEQVVGTVITVQRLPGDQVTAEMVGESAQNALAQALDPDHRAVAIHVDQASGLAGLLRPGDYVSAVGIVDPTVLGGVGRQRGTGAGSKLLLTGLKVLFVPYEFRYREVNTESSGLMSPAVASSGSREKGIIVLSVPAAPVTVTWSIRASLPEPTSTMTQTIFVSGPVDAPPAPNPAVRVSPVELLTLLDAQAQIYLVMEPAIIGAEFKTPGVYLDALLPDTNKEESNE